MDQKQFTLENLRLLDSGKIQEAFNHELGYITRDCMERPLDDQPRTVTIQFTLKPLPDVPPGGGTVDCDKVAVACDITSKIPKRKTRVYEMKPKHDGMLVFHPDLPEEPDGSTLYDPDQDRQKKSA